MGTRELKGLLRVLKDAGVASYTDGDLSLTFHDRSAQDVPRGMSPADAPTPNVDGAPADMDLPDGVWNPAARLDEIYRKNRARGAS